MTNVVRCLLFKVGGHTVPSIVKCVCSGSLSFSVILKVVTDPLTKDANTKSDATYKKLVKYSKCN